MEQMCFLSHLKLTKAQLQKIIDEKDYECLEISNGLTPSDGIIYKIDGMLVDLIDE